MINEEVFNSTLNSDYSHVVSGSEATALLQSYGELLCSNNPTESIVADYHASETKLDAVHELALLHILGMHYPTQTASTLAAFQNVSRQDQLLFLDEYLGNNDPILGTQQYILERKIFLALSSQHDATKSLLYSTITKDELSNFLIPSRKTGEITELMSNLHRLELLIAKEKISLIRDIFTLMVDQAFCQSESSQLLLTLAKYQSLQQQFTPDELKIYHQYLFNYAFNHRLLDYTKYDEFFSETQKVYLNDETYINYFSKTSAAVVAYLNNLEGHALSPEQQTQIVKVIHANTSHYHLDNIKIFRLLERLPLAEVSTIDFLAKAALSDIEIIQRCYETKAAWKQLQKTAQATLQLCKKYLAHHVGEQLPKESSKLFAIFDLSLDDRMALLGHILEKFPQRLDSILHLCLTHTFDVYHIQDESAETILDAVKFFNQSYEHSQLERSINSCLFRRFFAVADDQQITEMIRLCYNLGNASTKLIEGLCSTHPIDPDRLVTVLSNLINRSSNTLKLLECILSEERAIKCLDESQQTVLIECFFKHNYPATLRLLSHTTKLSPDDLKTWTTRCLFLSQSVTEFDCARFEQLDPVQARLANLLPGVLSSERILDCFSSDEQALLARTAHSLDIQFIKHFSLLTKVADDIKEKLLIEQLDRLGADIFEHLISKKDFSETHYPLVKGKISELITNKYDHETTKELLANIVLLEDFLTMEERHKFLIDNITHHPKLIADSFYHIIKLDLQSGVPELPSAAKVTAGQIAFELFLRFPDAPVFHRDPMLTSRDPMRHHALRNCSNDALDAYIIYLAFKNDQTISVTKILDMYNRTTYSTPLAMCNHGLRKRIKKRLRVNNLSQYLEAAAKHYYKTENIPDDWDYIILKLKENAKLMKLTHDSQYLRKHCQMWSHLAPNSNTYENHLLKKLTDNQLIPSNSLRMICKEYRDEIDYLIQLAQQFGQQSAEQVISSCTELFPSGYIEPEDKILIEEFLSSGYHGFSSLSFNHYKYSDIEKESLRENSSRAALLKRWKTLAGAVLYGKKANELGITEEMHREVVYAGYRPKAEWISYEDFQDGYSDVNDHSNHLSSLIYKGTKNHGIWTREVIMPEYLTLRENLSKQSKFTDLIVMLSWSLKHATSTTAIATETINPYIISKLNVIAQFNEVNHKVIQSVITQVLQQNQILRKSLTKHLESLPNDNLKAIPTIIDFIRTELLVEIVNYIQALQMSDFCFDTLKWSKSSAKRLKNEANQMTSNDIDAVTALQISQANHIMYKLTQYCDNLCKTLDQQTFKQVMLVESAKKLCAITKGTKETEQCKILKENLVKRLEKSAKSADIHEQHFFEVLEYLYSLPEEAHGFSKTELFSLVMETEPLLAEFDNNQLQSSLKLIPKLNACFQLLNRSILQNLVANLYQESWALQKQALKWHPNFAKKITQAVLSESRKDIQDHDRSFHEVAILSSAWQSYLDKTIQTFANQRHQIINKDGSKIVTVDFVLIKTKESYYSRAGASLCSHNDNYSWNSPNFFQMNMIDRDKKQLIGNIQFHKIMVPQKVVAHKNGELIEKTIQKPGFIVRPTPLDSFVDSVNYEIFFRVIEEVATDFCLGNYCDGYWADDNDYDAASNNEDIASIIKTRYSKNVVKIDEQILEDHTLKKIYPFAVFSMGFK